jgi:hypothetical protein
MDLSHHVRISGTFVIFQGTYGDGLCNTIDYIEPLVSAVVHDVNSDNSHDSSHDDGVHRALSLPTLLSNDQSTIVRANADRLGQLSASINSGNNSRGIVTPPPSCSVLPASSVTTTTGSTGIKESSSESQSIISNSYDRIHLSDTRAFSTTSYENFYIPPTKVAKRTTLEETITAISNTTITSQMHYDSALSQNPVTVSGMEVEDSVASSDPLLLIRTSVHSGGAVSCSDEDSDDSRDVPNHRHKASSHDEKEDHHHQQQQHRRIVDDQWESECRTIELYHRKEWYENALAQTTTTTIYSSISRTEKEQYSSILHPQHCMAYANQEMTDCHLGSETTVTNTTGSRLPSIPWWMSEETGAIAVLDQIPTPPIRIQTPTQMIGFNSNMLLPSATQCHRIESLWPGTIIVATELITLSSDTNNPEIPVFSPIAITPISDDDDDNDDETEDNTDHQDIVDSNKSTKVYLPGRLGWIQILKIISPISGYCVLSIDGYAFAGPGLPHQYLPGGRSHLVNNNNIITTSETTHKIDVLNLDNNISLQQQEMCNIEILDGWYWRVMCIEGAYVRNGIDLTAHHVATIPYGSLVRVLRKSINAMGLSRLQIEAIYYTGPTMTTLSSRNDNYKPQYVTGWISEFLNPLSGQRGPIVLPLPFPVPALYQVTIPEGAIIRSDVELSSPIIGHAPIGTVISVIGCTYTEQPKDQCVARYRLAGNGGYINVKLNVPSPHDYPVVKYIGTDDEFNPNEPKIFHLGSVQKHITNNRCHRQEQLSIEIGQSIYTNSSQLLMVGKNNRMTQQQRRIIELLRDNVNDDENDNDADDIYSDDDSTCVDLQSQRKRDEPTSTTRSMATIREKGNRHEPSSSSNHGKHTCVICLCEERTATIVHGETGHIVCCLLCARILKARGDHCPVCRLPIDAVIQHFWA